MFDIKKFLLILMLSLVISISYYFLFKSEKGITKDTITLGQSCALSGPISEVGIELRDGALSYFYHINENGGIYNREIKLITYDDKYEPELALENFKRLVDKDNIFALFGQLGTPTSKEVLPYTINNKIPFLTPFSGAEFLREPFKKNVINYRASYYEETEQIIKYLVDKLGHTRVAILYQNDSYGESGLNGMHLAMQKRGIDIIAKGIYKRNTLSITNALYKIVHTNPESVVIVGTYKPSALFIKRAKQMGLDSTIFANLSFVGSKSLIKKLNGDYENIIISQVTPMYDNTKNKTIQEYREIYKKYFPNSEYSFVSLEGFLSAKLVVEALKSSGKNITRRKFISAFENLKKDTIKGIDISLSNGDHQAVHQVFLSQYIDNKFRLVNETIK
jgi:ABC-type branched-subunit amino acid transport system substrate-binding protein